MAQRNVTVVCSADRVYAGPTFSPRALPPNRRFVRWGASTCPQSAIPPATGRSRTVVTPSSSSMPNAAATQLAELRIVMWPGSIPRTSSAVSSHAPRWSCPDSARRAQCAASRGSTASFGGAADPVPEPTTDDAGRDPPRDASRRLSPSLRDTRSNGGAPKLAAPREAEPTSSTARVRARPGRVRATGLRRAPGSPGARARPHRARASGSTPRRPRA